MSEIQEFGQTVTGDMTSTLVIRGADGRTLLEIKPDGAVIGEVADASEAARIFCECVSAHIKGLV